MSSRSLPIAVTILLGLTLSMFAADKVAPVRMGSGLMTFETVPGWGLDGNGKSVLGPTHGGVVVDKAGNIYTSANSGVFVFSPTGKVVRKFLGKDYTNIHDVEIRQEGQDEFIYAARNNAREGIKFHAVTGDIVLRLPFPEESGLNKGKKAKFPFSPTAITVAPNGDIILSNGYASNHIFKYDKTGKYLMHFGSKGNGLKQFNTAHGMTLDTRYDPPRILVCDRNHQPKGRLVHYSLDGKFIAEVVTGLGMPTSAAVQGDYVAVPDLHGRLVILDKSNTIISVLGHNVNPKTRVNFGVPQAKWVEGVFSGTHGSYWDKDGNLYVQDWNVSGRLMKLVRVNNLASTKKAAAAKVNAEKAKAAKIAAAKVAAEKAKAVKAAAEKAKAAKIAAAKAAAEKAKAVKAAAEKAKAAKIAAAKAAAEKAKAAKVAAAKATAAKAAALKTAKAEADKKAPPKKRTSKVLSIVTKPLTGLAKVVGKTLDVIFD